MAGTGLPLPKSDNIQTASPGHVSMGHGGDFSTADSWAKIAQSGQQIADTGTQWGKLEQHQQQVGDIAATDVEIANQETVLRDKFAKDPEGFKNAWESYRDGLMGEAPQWKVPHLIASLGHKGNTGYSAILTETRSEDNRLAREKLTVKNGMDSSAVIGAAMAGTLVPNTPEGDIVDPAVIEYRAGLQAGVSAKLHTEEWANAHMEDTMGKARGEIAAREGVAIYRKEGFPAAVEHLKKNVLENEDLQLKPQGRYQAFNRGLAAIRLEQSQDKQDRTAIVDSSKDLLARIKDKQPYDPAEARDTIDALTAVGAHAQARALAIAHGVRENTMGLNNTELARAAAGMRVGTANAAQANEFWGDPRSPTFQQDKLTQITTAGGKSLTVHKGAAAAFTGFLNELEARGYPLDNVGGFNKRMIAGSNTISQHAFGNAIDINPGRNPFLKGADKPVTDLPPDVSQLAAKYGLTWGGDWKNVKDAMHFEWTGPAGPEGAAPPDANAGAITAGVKKVLVDNSKRLWPESKAAITAGRVAPEDLQSIRYAAALSEDPKWMKDVEDHVAAHTIVEASKSLDAAGQQAVKDQARAQLNSETADLIDGIVDKRQKMERDNPVQLHIDEGGKPPMPLDVGHSDNFRAGLAERASIVRARADQQGIEPGTVLRPAEEATVQAMLAKGDSKAKAAIYADLATLPEKVRVATLAKLSDQKGIDNWVGTYAGALMKDAPDIGASVLRGREAMLANDKYNPLHGSEKTNVVESLSKALPDDVFSAADRGKQFGGHAVIRAAVLSRMADVAAHDPTFDGSFTDKMVESAVTDVTGGVLKHNGGSLIAPERGMTQQKFDGIMGGLEDKDLAGVTTLAGEPITAAYLRNSGRLQSHGDGTYYVQVGNNPQRPIYATRFESIEAAPQPFELDLRNRKEGGRLTTLGPYPGMMPF